jgi:DNA-binding response OmpR family regulator
MCTSFAPGNDMESMGRDIPAKTCLALLIIPHARIAARHRITLRVAGFDVRRIAEWDGDALDFDPEVVVVQLPSAHGSAADIGTRLRAKARFSPLILVGLSPSPAFESERRDGRHSGFDDVFPIDVEPTALLSRLHQLLAVRPPRTPCATNPSAA